MNALGPLRRYIRERSPLSLRGVCRQLARWQAARPETFDPFDRDWDFLFVLDACRADEFRRVAGLPGTTEVVRSGASMTLEWLERTVAGRNHHDVVYVTGNGQFQRHRDALEGEFHHDVLVPPDDESGVQTPESVASAVRSAATDYPNKRVVGHFIQPHIPYIGPTGSRFENGYSLPELRSHFDASVAELRQAYRENLELVLDTVADLLADLDGRIVITADHGELLGERLSPIPIRDFGHPGGVYHEKLVTVPWHVHESGPRRTVISERPTERTDESVDVENQLKALGYT